MVFCGKLSKACQRCRDRKLKCDLRSGSCGQCIRANAICTGYRDTKQLRIRNESQSVRWKVFAKENPSANIQAIPVSLESQAREVFYQHFVCGLSTTWDFLKPFYDRADSPDHLALSIDAVSLAYFSHQSYSQKALAIARQRYVSALHVTNKALQSPEVALEPTTLFSPLLLDLFEKITNSQAQHDIAWNGHVNGALALVKLHGLEKFESPATLRVLVRLGTNTLISCVSSACPVPEELLSLQSHAEKHLDVTDPKWGLTMIMVDFAKLHSDVRNGNVSVHEGFTRCMDIDARLLTLDLNMPPSWQGKRTFVNGGSERTQNTYFDTYQDRHKTQVRNVIRLIRIILNEWIIELCQSTLDESTQDSYSRLTNSACETIEEMSGEICASVPQYTNCGGVHRKVSLSSSLDATTYQTAHLHSPEQKLDCYTLIYPLYVVGWSKFAPFALRTWTIKELHYIGSHFDIRNADISAQILEREGRVDPWQVYRMLGSYAFVT